jgi:hypothetical protein
LEVSEYGRRLWRTVLIGFEGFFRSNPGVKTGQKNFAICLAIRYAAVAIGGAQDESGGFWRGGVKQWDDQGEGEPQIRSRKNWSIA